MTQPLTDNWPANPDRTLSNRSRFESPNALPLTGEKRSRPFPFHTSFSLTPLISYWENHFGGSADFRHSLWHILKSALSTRPSWRETVHNPSVEKVTALLRASAEDDGLLNALMSVAFPPVSWETDYMAAFIPFSFNSIYGTPSYEHLVSHSKGIPQWHNVTEEEMSFGRELMAYTLIARHIYGLEINQFEYPLLFKVTDQQTTLERYFRAEFNSRFCEIIPREPIVELRQDQKDYLMSHLSDLEVWREVIPASLFEFRGFTILTAVEVTDQEVLSGLKRDLIEKESIISHTRFSSLRHHIRALLHRPDLRMALAAVNKDTVSILNYNCEYAENKFTSPPSTDPQRMQFRVEELKGSPHYTAAKESRPILINDLLEQPVLSEMDQKLISKGLRNLFIAPLHYQGEVIGVLELSSPNPGDINPINMVKLKEVLPLFSMAVKRAREESNTEVQAVIKEKFTVIHPSVEWRFVEAAEKWITESHYGTATDVEDIVFRDVYPLYGVSDIRNSSLLRNAAIQADIIRQMLFAKEILELANAHRSLPIIEEMMFHLTERTERFKKALNSGDEAQSIEFLKQKVEPFFLEITTFSPLLAEKIDAYRRVIDPKLGLLYDKRKAFDDSVSHLSEAIASYLDQEQEKAQRMFPHYFERQKTDGVDHSMYIGASLTKDGKFDPMYIRNLRLWQLMAVCGIARLSDRLKETLPIPLDTAHLILVQSSPLSIRFHSDEKQFDVDGTYNIRYEIMKKRIDKAVVKGETQRVTQPGRIAIIYSQPREIQEYDEMIEYLQSIRYLTKDVEELDLEDLQGVHGLKARRITVNLAHSDDPFVIPTSSLSAL